VDLGTKLVLARGASSKQIKEALLDQLKKREIGKKKPAPCSSEAGSYTKREV
jgi:hypothetical protein